MDPHFWHERWLRNEIGFHQPHINTHLQNFWHRINAEPGCRVFVPLCGKSRDVLWLASLGYQVVGVECSPIAVETFFKENELAAQPENIGKFDRWQQGEICLLRGDFFDLTRADLGEIGAIYDRASLVALPQEMRQRYAKHLAELVSFGVPSLLITMEYPTGAMDGPPFSVSETEVQALFAKDFDVHKVHRENILDANPRFKERGLTQLDEVVHLLRRRD